MLSFFTWNLIFLHLIYNCKPCWLHPPSRFPVCYGSIVMGTTWPLILVEGSRKEEVFPPGPFHPYSICFCVPGVYSNILVWVCLNNTTPYFSDNVFGTEEPTRAFENKSATSLLIFTHGKPFPITCHTQPGVTTIPEQETPYSKATQSTQLPQRRLADMVGKLPFMWILYS